LTDAATVDRGGICSGESDPLTDSVESQVSDVVRLAGAHGCTVSVSGRTDRIRWARDGEPLPVLSGVSFECPGDAGGLSNEEERVQVVT
jgi:hypothetical protein